MASKWVEVANEARRRSSPDSLSLLLRIRSEEKVLLQYFFLIVSKVFLSAYSETQFCCGTNIRPGGEEEVKTMNKEPRKLMH